MTMSSDAVNHLLAQALAHYNARAFESSRRVCSTLLVEAPEHPAVHQLAVVLALDVDDLSGAKRHIVECLRARPDHGPTLLLAGKVARLEGDAVTASHFFEAAAARMHGTAEPLFLFAETLVERSSSKAIGVLHTLLEEHSRHSLGWCTLGQALRINGEHEAAINAFSTAVECDPLFGRAHFYLGTMLYSVGRFVDAVAILRRARALLPDIAEIGVNLGTALYASDDASAARDVFAEVLVSAPSEADAWFNLGLACHDMNDVLAAADAFRQALVHRSAYPEAALNLGIVLQEARCMSEAMVAYRQAVRLRPEDLGRVAHAIAAGSTGQVWMGMDHLTRELQA